jgi:hypothetical protein
LWWRSLKALWKTLIKYPRLGTQKNKESKALRPWRVSWAHQKRNRRQLSPGRRKE